ncbi:MAG: regulatory protein RecX [Candidatus Bruticola sp.]
MNSAEAEFRAFLERALHILSLRDHTCSELKQKLISRKCSAEVAQKIVDRCLEWNYLNDDRYAERFVQSKAAGGWGSRRIYNELIRRGLDSESARLACASLQEDSQTEFTSALELACRKAARGGNYTSVCRFLAFRGFPAEIVMKAAAQACKDKSSEE